MYITLPSCIDITNEKLQNILKSFRATNQQETHKLPDEIGQEDPKNQSLTKLHTQL